MSTSELARAVAEDMADAATAVLTGLDQASRAALRWPSPSGAVGDADEERRRWFYTPTDHGGLTVAAMTPTGYRRAMALVAAGLSPAAYTTVATIMGLENVLDHAEGFAGPSFARERGRDPGMYYLRIFGEPGERVWGWRFGGHHVSLNNLVVDGALVSSTPSFLGADPAASSLLGSATLRPLGGTEDLARSLVRSLDEEQRARAILTPRAPVDIVGANRIRVRPGDRVIPLRDLFRERFLDADLDRRMDEVHRAAEADYGFTAADHDAVALACEPRGVPARALDEGQRQGLRTLLSCYTGRAPGELASVHAAVHAGDGLDDVHFAWAGSTGPTGACYYRLEGPRLLVEYDNAQRRANHAHAVWRDPEGDFGADVLAAHRLAHHYPGAAPASAAGRGVEG